MTTKSLLQLKDGFYQVSLENQSLEMTIRTDHERRIIYFSEFCDTIHLCINGTDPDYLDVSVGVCGIRFPKKIHHSLLTLNK